MHERKIKMFEACDAFCVLPGGIGTLEEMVEVMSWSSLALHQKPVVLINTDNYWAPFIELVEHVCEEGFAYPGLRSILHVIDDPAKLVSEVRTQARPSMDKV
ncbi:MAG: LOG family protein, partial [Pseudomonadota bacterium]